MDILTTTRPGGPTLRRIRDGYWRVTGVSGAVLGYIERIESQGESLYRAKRLFSSNRVGDVGDFRLPDDAADCLR